MLTVETHLQRVPGDRPTHPPSPGVTSRDFNKGTQPEGGALFHIADPLAGEGGVWGDHSEMGHGIRFSSRILCGF